MIIFKIDMFEGRCIPFKNRPEGIAITVIAVIIPVLIAFFMTGFYFVTREKIEFARYNTKNYLDRQKGDKYQLAIKSWNMYEQEKKLVDTCIKEIVEPINSRTPWTPVIIEVVQNMPNDMVLTDMEVVEKTEKKMVQTEGEPNKKVRIDVRTSILKINIRGLDRKSYDKQVGDFKDRLADSKGMRDLIQDIKVERGKDSYLILCNFKSEI
ncbi:MAG: hypothetical protein ACYTBP_11185 [Planctomycetota bacterium]|jgi:hypothetical protein